MKFTVLGSCSGTEPMPGRRHTSTVLETGGKTYLLDAGDSCGYTMHTLGIDARKIDAVFISHPHIDHVGGLPYLFFLIWKLHSRAGTRPDRPLHIYTPSPAPVVSAMTLSETRVSGNIVTHSVEDGPVCDDGTLKVTARHNAHLGETVPPYHSFSYLLESEGRKIVYSGDVRSITELNPWLDCDLLMMETGHHDPIEIAEYLSRLPARPKRLLYVHHGRTLMADPDGCVTAARAILGDKVEAAFDGMTFEL